MVTAPVLSVVVPVTPRLPSAVEPPTAPPKLALPLIVRLSAPSSVLLKATVEPFSVVLAAPSVVAPL